MVKLFEPDLFQPTSRTAIVGRRFEPHFEPEWDCWCVIDRVTGDLYECEDQESADREADSLEQVRRMVEHLAEGFRWN